MGLRRSPGAAEVQFQRARLLVGALVQAGVRHVVTSPGSRSTPLVLAALDLAAGAGRAGNLELRSVLDERAAAFYALGQARATGLPSALICTSGSAPGHYLPAILEAKEAGLPLVVLSADRPVELMDCGAQQTTDQTKLFGSAVGFFAEVDLGGRTDDLSLRALRRTAAQAVFRSRWPRGGAVHLNVRARKPLERSEHPVDDALAAAVDALLAKPLHFGRPVVEPAPSLLDRAAEFCRQAARGLIVAGPLGLPSPERRQAGHDATGLVRLARVTGFPLVAEATSQSRFPGAIGIDPGACLAERLGAAWAAAGSDSLPRPDLIVRVGAPPVSTGTQRLLRTDDAPQVVLSDGPWTDPDARASLFLVGDVRASVAGLCSRLERDESGPADAEWRRRVLALSERFEAATAQAAENVARDRGPGTGDLHDGRIARAAVALTPAGGLLMLGNSLPVRVVETWAGRREHCLWVASQRGLSGIDGLVAGFLGSVSTGGFPAGVLLLGDVSLLHDLDGLTIASDYGDSPPAVIVVIDNQGGRIFEQLPIARTDLFQGPEGNHWLTPRGIDFGVLGQAFGLASAQVDAAAALGREIERAVVRRGVSLIVARSVPGALARAEGRLSRAMAGGAAAG